MNISQLPEAIKALARKNQAAETDPDADKYTDDLYEAFHFDDTPEGFDFWADIHCAEHQHQIILIRKAHEL